MKFMDLESAKDQTIGTDIPGTISIYLVKMPDGTYYAGEEDHNFFPKTVTAWHEAKFMFMFNGMLEAREIAGRFGGRVHIVSCRQPLPYENC